MSNTKEKELLIYTRRNGPLRVLILIKYNYNPESWIAKKCMSHKQCNLGFWGSLAGLVMLLVYKINEQIKGTDVGKQPRQAITAADYPMYVCMYLGRETIDAIS